MKTFLCLFVICFVAVSGEAEPEADFYYAPYASYYPYNPLSYGYTTYPVHYAPMVYKHPSEHQKGVKDMSVEAEEKMDPVLAYNVPSAAKPVVPATFYNAPSYVPYNYFAHSGGSVHAVQKREAEAHYPSYAHYRSPYSSSYHGSYSYPTRTYASRYPYYGGYRRFHY